MAENHSIDTDSMLLMVIPRAIDMISLSFVTDGAISAVTLRTKGGFTAMKMMSFF